MDRIVRMHSSRLMWALLLFAGLNAQVKAQVCGCPSLTNVTAQTPMCNLLNSGTCTVCPNSNVTFSINSVDQLVPGTTISWYVGTDPNFDPNAGQGDLVWQHAIPPLSCSSPLVKINEFMPWPDQGDNDFGNPTTGEWVELIGPPGVNLGCYVLSDGDWTITIPPGTTMPSDGFFVIGYDEYGPVDLDVDTCNCFVESFPNETLTLHNTGEWLVLWNGFSFVDAIRYGNPSLANVPPFGNLVTLGAIPTKGMPPCNASIPISFPAFTIVNALPQKGYSYEREPDYNGTWSLEDCGSRGYCNYDQPVNLPLQWTYNIPPAKCNQTLYVKAIATPYPSYCPALQDGLAAGPFVLNVHCPQTLIDDLLCPGESVVVNNVVYDQSHPSGTEVLKAWTGCDSTVTVNLQYHPQATADLGSNTVICQGDSAQLTIQFSGDGPFQYIVNTAGSPGPLQVANTSSASFWVKPSVTTVYSLNIVVDDHGCEGQVTGGATVTVNAPQGNWTASPTSLCPGDTAHLNLNVTGYAPWTVNFTANGIPKTGTTGSGGSLGITPSDTTQYVIQTVSDAYGCNVSLTGPPVTVNVTPPPLITGPDITCLDGDSLYVIDLQLAGGIPGTWSVTGLPGQWAGSAWTSNPVKSLTPFVILVDDAGPCPADTLSGVRNCDCATSPGKLLPDTLHLCPGQAASPTFLEDPIKEPGDTLLYILHTQSDDPLGTALATAAGPGFTWQAGWPKEQVLYLSVGVSDKSPGGLDLSDPCLDFTKPVPLVFHDLPSAMVSLPSEICGTKCAMVTVSDTGHPPVQIQIVWGQPGQTDTLTSVSGTGTHILNLCGSDQAGPMNLQWLSISDLYCATALTGVENVDHPLPPVVDLSPSICPKDSILLSGIWYHAGHLTDTLSLGSSTPLGCDTLVRIRVNLFPPADTLIQKTLCNGTILAVGDSLFHENHPAGQVLLAGAGLHGCDSLVTVDLTFTDYTEFLLNPTLCPSDTLWVNGHPYSIALPSGTETYPGGSYLGCDSVVNIDLQFFPELSLSLSGDQTLCPGDDAHLNLSGTQATYDLLISGTNGQTVQFAGWKPGDPLSFVPAQAGTYQITQATSPSQPCPVSFSGSAAISVEDLQIQPTITSDFHGADISCPGAKDGSLNVSVSGNDPPYQFQWADGATGAIRTGLGPGTYQVTVTSATGCTRAGEVSLTAPLPFLAGVQVTDNPCGLSLVHLVQVQGGTPPWQWTADGQNWTPVTLVPEELSFPDAGVFLLQFADANGCLKDTTLQVHLGTGGITVQAFPDTLIGPGQPVQITLLVNGNAVETTWSPPYALSCTTCPEPVASPSISTTYQITVVDDQGCEDIAIVRIEVLGEENLLYIPTAFSPNLDGINDTFIPDGDASSVRIEELSIYDRWGNALWSAGPLAPGDASNGWDGTFRGKIMDPGVYVFALRVMHLPTKTLRTYQGEVLLMR